MLMVNMISANLTIHVRDTKKKVQNCISGKNNLACLERLAYCNPGQTC